MSKTFQSDYEEICSSPASSALDVLRHWFHVCASYTVLLSQLCTLQIKWRFNIRSRTHSVHQLAVPSWRPCWSLWCMLSVTMQITEQFKSINIICVVHLFVFSWQLLVYHHGNMNGCTRFHGDLFKSCWRTYDGLYKNFIRIHPADRQRSFLTVWWGPFVGFGLPAFLHEVHQSSQPCEPRSLTPDLVQWRPVSLRDAKFHDGGLCIYRGGVKEGMRFKLWTIKKKKNYTRDPESAALWLPALKPTTANEWSCGQETNTLVFLLS